ncbi:Pycsar system effector family protein [Actinoplanes missouriensis]|nr:Pycsar system effector family protein [Actinoplanes missouriensis]
MNQGMVGAPTAPVTRSDASAEVRLTRRLIAETREEVRRADAKAAQWLSILGAGTAGLIALWGVPLERAWPVAGAPAGMVPAGLICVALAAAAFALALFPRTRGASDLELIAYFGHVYRLRDPDRVRRCLEQAAGDTMAGLVSQLCWLSRLAVLKFRWIRAGTVFGMLAAVLFLAVAL